MARALDREKLLQAFDEIGRAAVAAGTCMQIAVYGGSALMLASNFRFATEDVYVSRLQQPWPDWLRNVVEKLTRQNGWAADWFNDGVVFHLSEPCRSGGRSFGVRYVPRNEQPGLLVYVPSAEYLLALKLKAIRVNDPVRGDQERLDILNLMRVVGINTAEDAIALLTRLFPNSGAAAEKQKFLLTYTEPRRSPRCAQIPSPRRLNASVRESRRTLRWPSSSTVFFRAGR
jgi:hypothetical protein